MGSEGNRGDLVFALTIMAVAIVTWIGTAGLPPPRWEPLGSAALPRGIAAIMALLALAPLARSLGRARGEAVESDAQWWRALVAFAIAVAYVAAMDMRLLSFIPATLVFLMALGLVLSRFTWRRMPLFFLFALALTVGCHQVFTRLFYIDLP